jgi:hypothetical protein
MFSRGLHTFTVLVFRTPPLLLLFYCQNAKIAVKRAYIQGRALSSVEYDVLGRCRGRGVVPTQGEDCYSPPFGRTATAPPWGGLNRMRGVSRSWGGHLRPQFTTYSLDLSGTCTDLLAMLMSKADHMLMNLVDCGRARAALALNP